MKGRIHSIESMGLVDGPGIRSVVFFQGCALRCRFCHNPDSWSFTEGEEIEARDIVSRLTRFRSYYKRSGGGVTFSGGEPLQQPVFLLELLRLCRQAGIHTCLDTAGIGRGDYEEILRYTDLVLYDVKEITPERYEYMTGGRWEEQEPFQKALLKSGVPFWIRHVVVPGMGDSSQHMEALREYIQSRLPGAEKVELLPYHTLGKPKYRTMGIPDPLEGTESMDREKVKQWQKQYFHTETEKGMVQNDKSMGNI